jgi:PAS domain S-box-containing protein
MIGIIVWIILDYVQTARLKNIFQTQLAKQFAASAKEDRNISERYVEIFEKEVDKLLGAVILKTRQERASVGFVLILTFTFIMYWITRHIQQIIKKITDFSRDILGKEPPELQQGDQLYILEERLRQLTEEVIEAREIIKTQTEKKTNLIVNNTFDAIITTNSDGVIEVWNPQAENIFGWSSEEVVGRMVAETIIPPQYQKVYKDIKQTSLTSKKIAFNEQIETTVYRRDGQEFPVELSVSTAQSGDNHSLVTIIRDITERKRAEELLKISSIITGEGKARLETIFDAIGDSISIQNTDFKILYQNISHRDVFGDHVGEYCYKVYQNRDQVCKGCHLVECFKNGRTHKVEQYRITDGGIRCYEITASPLKDSAGKVIAGIEIMRDITARKKSEIMLRESEEKFRTIFENIGEAIFIHDFEGRFLEVNSIACSRLGYSKEELIQMTPMDIDTPENALMVPQRLEKLRKVGHICVETAHVRRDGSVIPVELISRIIRYGGRPAVLSIAKDITQRKQTEKNLKKERDRVQTYLSVAGIIFVVIDLDQKVNLINKKGCEILECREDEIIGMNWFNTFVPERVRDRVKGVFEKLIAGKVETAEYYEYPILTRRNGKEKIIAWHNTVLRDEAGNIVGTVSSGTDITERKKAEEALHNALTELQQRHTELSSLLKASRMLLKNREFKNVVRSIFDNCKDLIGADTGYVSLSNNEILFLETGRHLCNLSPDIPIHVRRLQTEAYRTGKVVFCNDLTKDFVPEGHINFENIMFAPMVVEGKALGLLALANKSGGFTEKDISLASAFAELCAIALLNSRMLEELKNSEERFRSVVETATDAIISVDSKGSIVSWNNAARAIFGYSEHEVISKPLTILIPERFREFHERGFKRVVSRGKTNLVGKTIELTGLNKDGREFPVELSLAARETSQGIFLRVLYGILLHAKGLKMSLRRQKKKWK